MPFPLFFLGLLLTLYTGFRNIGIIGLDDYLFVLVRVIPAQTINFSEIISDAFWSPALPVLLACLSKVALFLGFDHPVSQLRFVLMVSGAVTFSICAFTAAKFFEGIRQELALFLMGFFFLCPLLFSRPMIETAAAPLILVSAYGACRYWAKGDKRALMVSVVALSLASVFRFQVGVCILVPAALVLWRRKPSEVATFLGISVACFVATGLLDRVFSGAFHGTLFNYVKYNLNIAHGHGRQPFYVFPALFVLLTIPPAFFSRYRGFDFKKEFAFLFPAVLYFVVFLVSHTLTPHKEERFMIPVIPLFLVLLVPLAHSLFFQKWRVVYFLGMNALLLPVVVFTIPQANVIRMVQFLDSRPQFTKVLGVGDTLVLYPSHYASKEAVKEEIGFDMGRIERATPAEAIAVREDLLEKVPGIEKVATKIGEFPPDFIEGIFVRLNPKHNTRRATIHLFSKR